MALPWIAADAQGLLSALSRDDGNTPSRAYTPSRDVPEIPSRPTAESDASLVARIRAGEANAFAELFDRYYLPLAGFTESIIRSDDAARDIVHDVLLRIWINHHTWTPKSSVAAYLFTAVRNAARTRVRDLRSAAHITNTLAAIGERAGSGAGPLTGAETIDNAERAALLRHALVQLAERRREVVLLRWSGELSFKEIAAILGMTVRAVENLHARALDDLRRLLAGRLP
jgi:RNA polymerase sigma-70 factor (ECF subfamily)